MAWDGFSRDDWRGAAGPYIADRTCVDPDENLAEPSGRFKHDISHAKGRRDDPPVLPSGRFVWFVIVLLMDVIFYSNIAINS